MFVPVTSNGHQFFISSVHRRTSINSTTDSSNTADTQLDCEVRTLQNLLLLQMYLRARRRTILLSIDLGREPIISSIARCVIRSRSPWWTIDDQLHRCAYRVHLMGGGHPKWVFVNCLSFFTRGAVFYSNPPGEQNSRSVIEWVQHITLAIDLCRSISFCSFGHDYCINGTVWAICW